MNSERQYADLEQSESPRSITVTKNEWVVYPGPFQGETITIEGMDPARGGCLKIVLPEIRRGGKNKMAVSITMNEQDGRARLRLEEKGPSASELPCTLVLPPGVCAVAVYRDDGGNVEEIGFDQLDSLLALPREEHRKVINANTFTDEQQVQLRNILAPKGSEVFVSDEQLGELKKIIAKMLALDMQEYDIGLTPLKESNVLIGSIYLQRSPQGSQPLGEFAVDLERGIILLDDTIDVDQDTVRENIDQAALTSRRRIGQLEVI